MHYGREHDEALRQFEEQRLERINELTRTETPNDTLFHYTRDLAGVSGILRESRMRFGSVCCLNDKIELTYGLRLFRKIVRQQYNAKDRVVRHFLKPMCDPGFRDLLFERFHFYTASFGPRDSSHMWEFYGGRSRGFAIGVDASVFAPSDLETIPYDEQYYAGRVRYKQTKIRDLHRETIQRATRLIHLVSQEPLFLQKLAVGVYGDALVTSLTSKEIKWASEHEHRLFVIEDLERPRRTVHRPERPYIEMTIPKKAFVEIMLGSKVTHSDREAISRVLKDHGLTANVTQSACY